MKLEIEVNIILVKKGKRARFLIDYMYFFKKNPEILKRIQSDPDLKLEGRWVCHITDNFKFKKVKLTKNTKEDHMERGIACGIPIKAINHFIEHGISKPCCSYNIAVTRDSIIQDYIFGFVYKDMSF